MGKGEVRSPMKSTGLYFTAPHQVEVREEELPPLPAQEVLVKTSLSAISAGTEMLIYRGQAPTDLAADDKIAALQGDLNYPLKYGYSAVGEVIDCGEEVAGDWLGRVVFAFNPHENHFQTDPSNLLRLPEQIPVEDAVFLPNMETAVNFIMDGQPLLGEKAALFGQGVVGLLTAALLAEYPLAVLLSIDAIEKRRKTSRDMGVHESLGIDEFERALSLLDGPDYAGADLIFELSGNPDALNQAIQLAGFNGRIVVGSWYGQKQANLDLGGEFHRKRIKLISSQVSTLTPELRGRWSRARRYQTAWDMLAKIKPSRLISHQFSIEDAAEAYKLLDDSPGEALQVVLKY